MMAANDRRISEARDCIREAEKCMKTGFLKWKPDYDGAALEYGKAAIAFKNAKAYDEAIDCYMKQADAQKQTGSIFHAAKAVEAAGMLHKETGNFAKAADLIEQAATMYLEHGTQDTAAVVLDRAGKMLEQNLPERAIKLFMRACDVAEAEDRPHQCAEYVGKAARLLIRTKRLEEAAAALRREMDYYSKVDNQGLLNKLVMGIVLVHLHLGDYVAADQAFKQSLSRYAGFAQSEEARPIERLLDAYYQCDQETAEQIAKSPLFRYMENDFTKLARDLKVPGGGTKKSAGAGGEAGNDATEGLADDVEELDLR